MQKRPATALGSTMTLQIVAAAIFTAFSVIAPALPESMHLDKEGLGIYGALTFLGAMFGSSIAATMISRFGPIRLIQMGMLFSCLSLAVLYTEMPVLIFASAVCIGLGYGPNAPGGSLLLSAHTPPARRGLIFSIKQSGVPIGGAVIGIVLPGIEAGWGWQTALLVVVALGPLGILAVQPWQRRLDSGAAALMAPRAAGFRLTDLVPVGVVRNTPGLAPLAFMSFTYAAGQMVLGTYLVTYLVEQVELTLVAAGAAFSAFQISSFAVRVGAGWLNDRLRRPRQLLASFGVVTAATGLALAATDAGSAYAWIVTLSALAGAGAAGWNGVFLAEISRQVPDDRIPAATAASVFCTYFGLVVGPAAFSALLAGFGYPVAFGALSVFVLLGAGTLMVFGPGSRFALNGVSGR